MGFNNVFAACFFGKKKIQTVKAIPAFKIFFQNIALNQRFRLDLKLEYPDESVKSFLKVAKSTGQQSDLFQKITNTYSEEGLIISKTQNEIK